MFYLSDIFKFIVDRFNKSSFAKHNFVSHGQQRVPHVVFNLGNELDSVHEQGLKQLFADKSHYQQFEIPDTWVWTTLGEIFSMQAGKSIHSQDLSSYSENCPYPCYGGNGVRGFLSRFSHKGTYPIIGRQGALCGNINVAQGTFYATEHAVVVECFANTNTFLWALFLEYLNLNQYATSTAQPGLSVAKIEEVPIPLPPIEEQERIVSNIHKWFGLIEHIGNTKASLSDTISLTKSKILDLAMQGMLVSQNLADEPAADMLLRINPKAKIITDNPQCRNMPLGWTLCQLRDLCSFLSRGKSPKYSETPNQYPVFAQKCNLKDGDISLSQARFLDESTISKWPEKYRLRDGDVLVNSTGTGTVGRTRIFKSEYLGDYPFVVPDSHVSVVRSFDEIESTFIFYSLYCQEGQQYFDENLAGSTNQKELYIDVIGDRNIMLPPINEQKRIIAKVEELYFVLDTIEASLRS